MDESHVLAEVELLKGFLQKIGKPREDGKVTVSFGELFDMEECQDTLESLVGTLKAARKRGAIDWKGQMLLKGAHDDVMITLL